MGTRRKTPLPTILKHPKKELKAPALTNVQHGSNRVPDGYAKTSNKPPPEETNWASRKGTPKKEKLVILINQSKAPGYNPPRDPPSVL